MSNVWFITGSARGMGVSLAQAALSAGHSVVATARDAAKVTAALGEHENLLALSLDITDPKASIAAAEAAVERFGSIDVLVNNAGNFYAGYFEVISDAQAPPEVTNKAVPGSPSWSSPGDWNTSVPGWSPRPAVARMPAEASSDP